MPSAAYFRIFAKIVQTRAETNLFGYAECSLFSHFCKDSANEGQKNHLVMPNVAYFRILRKDGANESRNQFIWLRRVTVYFHVFGEIAISVKRLNKNRVIQ